MATGLFEQLKKTTTSLPKEWQKILTPGTAAYEAAILLNLQGALPKLVTDKTDKDSYNAQYDSEANVITLNSNTKDKSNAISHEITHALGYKMQDVSRSIQDKLEKKVPVTTSEQQFFNGWQKLDPDFSTLKKMKYPGSYNEYRHSFKEAPAWAVGNMEGTQPAMTPGGSHVDATLAQEQAILRDLYGRTQKPKQQEASTPWYKDPFGFTIK